MGKIIIAIFGNSAHGKSTAAKLIEDEVHATVINFADPVKVVGEAMVGIPLSISHGTQDDKATYQAYGKSARQWLQWIGTEVGRDGVDNHVWVDRFIDKAEQAKTQWIIAGDGRFPDEEFLYLKKAAEARGHKVYGAIIRRPAVPVNMEHRSESIVAKVDDSIFDARFLNEGSLDDLRGKLSRYVQSIRVSNPEHRKERFGGYITTFTGIEYYPCDPRPDDVTVEDIAHSLSFKNRWNSHSVRPISVGWHSVQVMKLIVSWYASQDGTFWSERQLALVMLWALFHDAHEAYLADIPTKVKPFIPGWRELEDLNDKAIFKALHIDMADMPPKAKEALIWADKAMGGAEGRALTKANPEKLRANPSVMHLLGAGVVMDPKVDEDWRAVKREFISCYERLKSVLERESDA